MGGFDFTDDHHDDMDIDKLTSENEKYFFFNYIFVNPIFSTILFIHKIA